MGRVIFEGGDNLDEDNLRDWLPRDNMVNYCGGGAAVTADFANNEVTVDAGRVHLVDSGGLYTIYPPQTTLTLPDPNGTNFVYGRFDPGTDDSAEWVIDATKGGPADPKVLKATVDGSNDTTTLENEDPTADFKSVTADELSIDGQAIQAAQNGMVVPVGDGLGTTDAVDPSTVGNPLQTAVDIVNNGPGCGTVIIGPFRVQETDTLTWRSGINLLHMAPNLGVEWTSAPAGGSLVDIPGIANFTWSDIHLFGPGDGAATTHGIQFSGNADKFALGRTVIKSLAGTAFDENGNKPFDYRIRLLQAKDVDAGAGGGVVNFSGGPGGKIGHLAAYPSDTSSGSDSRVVLWDNGVKSIGSINVGGTASAAVFQNDGTVNVGAINYEPVGQNATPDAICTFKNRDPAIIGSITGTAGSADYVYKHGFDAGSVVMPPYRSNGTTINSNIVNIAKSPAAPSWYFGPSSDIDNSAGSSTNDVRSLATAGNGNG